METRSFLKFFFLWCKSVAELKKSCCRSPLLFKPSSFSAKSCLISGLSKLKIFVTGIFYISTASINNGSYFLDIFWSSSIMLESVSGSKLSPNLFSKSVYKLCSLLYSLPLTVSSFDVYFLWNISCEFLSLLCYLDYFWFETDFLFPDRIADLALTKLGSCN